MEQHEFICPECGGTEPCGISHISTEYNPGDPWSRVLQTISCSQCGYDIPAHLAERWDDMTMEEAQREWKSVYKG